MANTPMQQTKETILWQGRPSAGTAFWKYLTERYTVTSQRLRIEYGLLNRRTEEIELFRLHDLAVEKSIFDRLFGVGNIVLQAGDTTSATTVLYDISGAELVKDIIRNAARAERQRNRVGVFEQNWPDNIEFPETDLG